MSKCMICGASEVSLFPVRESDHVEAAVKGHVCADCLTRPEAPEQSVPFHNVSSCITSEQLSNAAKNLTASYADCPDDCSFCDPRCWEDGGSDV